MFKKFFSLALAILLLATFSAFNAAPVFFDYADRLELYLGDAGSAGEIISVDKKDYFFIKGISGESFKADKENFDLQDFLDELDAQIILVEKIEQGISLYAFSSKIKYRSQIDGKTVNLHIFVGQTITVGSPLIFGSF